MVDRAHRGRGAIVGGAVNSKGLHRDKEGEDVFLMRLIPPRARGPAGLVTRKTG